MPVYIVYYAGDFSITTYPGHTKTDASDGVNLDINTVERLVKSAIDEINATGITIKLTYGGRVSSSALYTGPSIKLFSPTSSYFQYWCGTAQACVPLAQTDWVMFAPESPIIDWTTEITNATQRFDFSGTATHELLHTLGLKHSNSPTCTYGSHPVVTDVSTNPDPASILNTVYDNDNQMRRLMRDDIEGLRALWGMSPGSNRELSYSESSSATSASWSMTYLVSNESQVAPAAASSVPTTHNGNEIHVIGSTWYTADRIVVTTQDPDSSSFTVSFPDLSTQQGKAYQRFGVAHGAGKTLVVWVDESDKLDWEPPLRRAIRTEPSGTWSVAQLSVSGLPVRATTPEVALGYDRVSGRFLASFTSVRTALGSRFIAAPTIATINDQGLASFPNAFALTDVHALGKPVCDSGTCLIPYSSVSTSGTYLGFYRGTVSGSSFVYVATQGTGYYSYSDVDAAVGPGGDFAVTFSQGGDSRWVGRKLGMTGGIDNFTSFYNRARPLALGTATRYLGRFTYGPRYRLYAWN